MAPCSRARCRHCGMTVGMMGVWLKPPAARSQVCCNCSSTRGSRQLRRSPCSQTGSANLVEFSHMPKDELKQLRSRRPTKSCSSAPRPFHMEAGVEQRGPAILIALGMGPRDPGEIVVKARPARLSQLRRAPCQEAAMSLDVLSNELPLVQWELVG